MTTNKKKGFTLIELLVVIAIIGILSAVVLASLSTARQKGNDAAVQSNLATIQTEAELFYGGTGANSYGTAGSGCATAGSLFVADTSIKNAITAATAVAKSNTIACNNSTTAYAVQALLTAPTATTYWCIDSTGRVATSSAALGAATVCP